MKKFIFFIFFTFALCSCSHDAEDSPQNVTSTSLTYNLQNVLVLYTPVNLSPTFSGGTAVSYSISPALPAGLSLDTTTGVISGIAWPMTPERNYTVTATDFTGGTTDFILVITIDDAAPSSLSYTTQNMFVKNYSIVNLTPTVSGGAATNFSISPALPAGLSINAATGVISGTPVVASSMNTYTVTAANSSGSISFGVVITVNNQISRLSSMVISHSGTTERYIYLYQDGLLSEIFYSFPTPLSFNGTDAFYYYINGKLDRRDMRFTGDTGESPYMTTKYFYTGDLITSETNTYLNITNTFGYDSSDQLVSFNSIEHYEYYPDGNLYKINTSDPANTKVYHSYDTKSNPFRLGGFTSGYLRRELIPINNPTAMNDETYVYEYNMFNYPEKKTTYINGVVQSITTYSYQ